ncbi:hypothetical protein [Schlesneria paludicola]|uniref:hypothetical protein n=1 Tax=Schlesneria paludicola TaxID=360056 RepID=UPI000299D7C0|nr:hypothetical protein [Schlesneria paludicola]
MLRAICCCCQILFVLCLFPTLSHSQVNKLDSGIKTFLAELNETNPKVAKEFQQRQEQSQQEIASAKKGHVIFGRIVLDDGRSPRSVVSQMILLEDGSFVDAVGAANRPIGFRLHGYEAINVIPKGPGPIENLGEIHMKPLPAEQLASGTGRIEIEAHPGVPRLDKIQLTWSIAVDPVNTPSNGTDGLGPFHQIFNSDLAKDGTFTVIGMSPAKYDLWVTAPNCVMQHREIVFTEGESQELPPIPVEVVRKMDVEFAVSHTSNFTNAKYAKTSLKADDRWRASDEIPEYASDLVIGQHEGKLLLRHAYGPCHVKDLGAGQLSDRFDVDLDELDGQQKQGIPVEDGHVYLVHQANWRHWIVMRTTLPKVDAR